ncbi:MAG: hypothetical protein JWO82_3479 [Akkermansiaceae bacterium]|nr:hypothetical protein [Akkermansiaceae bacterium]
MKKAALLLSACGLVLGGYLLGRASSISTAGAGLDATATAAAGRPSRETAGEEGGRKTADRGQSAAPRNRLAQAHFSPGGARQWMREVQRGAGDGNSLLSRMRILETCCAMDAADARETATEALAILRSLREDDPIARADFPSRDLQMQMANAALYRLAQLDAGAALDFAKADPAFSKNHDFMQMIFTSMAEQDLPKATAVLATLEGQELSGSLEGVMNLLDLSDPQAAAKLLEGFPDPRQDNERKKLIERVAASDPALALKLATGYVAEGKSAELLSAALEKGGSGMRQQISAWAATYDGPNAGAVHAAVLNETAKTDPAEARAMYTEHQQNIPPGDQERSARILAESLVKADLGQAVEWTGGLDDGAGRKAAEQTVAKAWLSKDPDAAVAWIATIEDPVSHDDAAEQAAYVLSKDRIQDAFKLLPTMRDEERGGKTFDRLVAIWSETNPQAAHAMMMTARARKPRPAKP